jgi:hypothetical protein
MDDEIGRTKPSRTRTKPSRLRALADLDRRKVELDRRSIEYQRYEDIRGSIVSDLGGPDAVSTAEAQIADKAAFIARTLEMMQAAALSGGEIDLQRYGELVDRLRRQFDAIGLQRRARQVEDSIESIAAEIAAGRVRDTGDDA